MTQPTPTEYADGDVRIEPQGRAVAVRQLNQRNQAESWTIITAGQGLRIASSWEVDAVKAWEPLTRGAPAAPAAAGKTTK